MNPSPTHFSLRTAARRILAALSLMGLIALSCSLDGPPGETERAYVEGWR